MKTRYGAVALAALAAALWWWQSGAPADQQASSVPLTAPSMTAMAPATAPLAASGAASVAGATIMHRPADPSSTQTQRAIWQARYDRAEQALSVYRESTRYPPTARPMQEHPDQVRPFDPVQEVKPLRNPGGEPTPGVHLRTSQERVFLSGAESSRFTVSAVDDEGKPLPLTVSRALAYSLPDAKRPAQTVQTPIVFADGGGEADTQANDGIYSARLQPSTQGFGNFEGGIRVQLEVKAKGQSGQLSFDVVYGGNTPATWGAVSEALQDGSLNFFLQAQVRQAGRYVVSARVDDAQGKPFALLTFNEAVGEGAQTLKLSLHGLLVRDMQPAFPLRLRDVEGFLLHPDRFPDRAMMPRQAGVVHTSASYPSTAFTDKEWTSEERERYLAEFGRDLDRAKEQLQRLTP